MWRTMWTSVQEASDIGQGDGLQPSTYPVAVPDADPGDRRARTTWATARWTERQHALGPPQTWATARWDLQAAGRTGTIGVSAG